MLRLSLLFAALGGATAVMLGAFGAHALEDVLTPARLATFTTAVHYQMSHSLALLATGLLMLQWPAAKLLRASAALFMLGIAIFSGSLYLLVATDLGWLGAITPIGGTAMIAGWLLLAAALWRATGARG